ncbi:hypothetical protein GPECTOR_58g591 [Gonium pectorale]|uniref:EF-hand domain-containing protein n=1 Tax=Gonium pectorale TaxID=33097 RepID=A0A150G5L0_GONPE|nr:hypothetical protein GPECTOR_58g591 [Gonium pectorale]|eukprot:KXZ45142.1 hypothetical protein GPECTOR_58g591 [Gonium pectorale]
MQPDTDGKSAPPDAQAQDGRGSKGKANPFIRVETGKGQSMAISIKSIMTKVGSQRRFTELGNILAEMDSDQSGTIDVEELLHLVEGLAKTRREKKWMAFIIIALFIFALATIGTIVGLTYAVMSALKDTQVEGNTMYVKGTTDVVRTGSAEFTVVDGIMVSRKALNETAAAALASANTTLANDPSVIGSTTPSQGVLRTASFVGTPRSFSSQLNVRALMELQTLYMRGAGDVEIALRVDGVARVPMEGSVWGTVVRIVTVAGTITLDDIAVSFSSSMADIFVEAGFRVSRNRRALIGFYWVTGFFQFLDEEVFKNQETLPELGASARPYLPVNYLMKMRIAEPCVIPHDPTVDRCVFIPEKPPISDGITVVVPPGTRRSLRTQPFRRTAQDAGSSMAKDLAGVEIIDGVRYMLQTALFCSEYKQPTVNLRRAATDTYNFTYEGLDVVNDRSARHFRLTILQAPAEGADAGGIGSVLSVDYWDAVSDLSPLAFEFNHSSIGLVTIHVLEFRNLTADSPEIVGAFESPNATACYNDINVPRLSSPFTVIVTPEYTYELPTEMDTASSGDLIPPEQRRALAEKQLEYARIWQSLDHVNGTGDWPDWALELVGGVRPGPSKRNLVSTSFWDSDCAKLTYGVTIPAGVCDIEMQTIWFRYLGLSVMCGGNVGSTPIVLRGGIAVNECEKTVCIGYNFDQKVAFVTGVFKGLYAWLIKAEIGATLMFTACCAWIDEVWLEGFVGVDFFFWSSYSSIGKVTFVKSKYLKGDPTEAYRSMVPAATNMAGWQYTGMHNWGDLQSIVYCSSTTTHSSLKGLPVNGLMVRVESPGGDDTALNGIRKGFPYTAYY